MSVQPSLNNSNMVVAQIINEINSTQPSGNYSQNTRATPIQRPQMPCTKCTTTTKNAYNNNNHKEELPHLKEQPQNTQKRCKNHLYEENHSYKNKKKK